MSGPQDPTGAEIVIRALKDHGVHHIFGYPGGAIMLHGIGKAYGWLGALHRKSDWTLGCIAVTNEEIEEIWSLVPDGTPIEIRP